MVFLQILVAFCLIFNIASGVATLLFSDKVTKKNYFMCWICSILYLLAYATEKFR